jgi:hypothetical protein
MSQVKHFLDWIVLELSWATKIEDQYKERLVGSHRGGCKRTGI